MSMLASGKEFICSMQSPISMLSANAGGLMVGAGQAFPVFLIISAHSRRSMKNHGVAVKIEMESKG